MVRHFSVKKITGVKCFNPCVYDEHGKFYIRNGDRYFNLPSGEYKFYDCDPIFTNPLKYDLEKLPFRERIWRVPTMSDINVKIASDNMTKIAMVNVHDRTIYINPVVLTYTTPAYFAVLFHELGHFMYKSEQKCDLYAINKMLENGFNPSQILDFVNVLPGNELRKQLIVEKAKKADAKVDGLRRPNIVRSIFS